MLTCYTIPGYVAVFFLRPQPQAPIVASRLRGSFTDGLLRAPLNPPSLETYSPYLTRKFGPDLHRLSGGAPTF